MSRNVTAAVDTALDQPTIARRWLVEIAFDSGTARYWDGFGDLPALGQTWTGTGRLARVEPIKEAAGLTAQGATIQLTILPTAEIPDAPDLFLTIALTEEYQGRPVTIYVGLIDLATNQAIADPFPRFRGYLDVVTEEEAPGAARLTIACENKLIDLERPRGRTYTPEDHKVVYPADTFFDHVATLQNREIVLKDRRK